MAGSAPKDDVFDLDKIRRLVELMKEHDLAEVDLRQGEARVQLRRGVSQPAVELGAPPAGPTQSAASAAPGPAADAGAEPSGDDRHLKVVTSPMVGTFYLSSDPDSPPYVKIGDHVGPETTVCIIEAMKVFNQIPSGVSGKLVAVLAENGEPVEFGQPLFKVDTRE
jgi:acetyl-CoA carboxylase biotin carboxyl carrier protein